MDILDAGDWRFAVVTQQPKTIAQKGHIKPGSTVSIVNAVAEVVDILGLPEDTAFAAPEMADVVLLFVSNRSELESVMRPAAEALSSRSILWVFFRRGARAAGLDMSRNDVWEVADSLSMRPMGLVSVDDRWSAFRLRHGLG